MEEVNKKIDELIAEAEAERQKATKVRSIYYYLGAIDILKKLKEALKNG